MKAIGDRTTAVLAGAFNPAILNPKWVAEHALGHQPGQDFPVEMQAPIGGPGNPRYTFDGFSYSAGFKSLILHLEGGQVGQCQRAVTGLANILGQLPHSPVTGLGFNFAFLVEAPTAALLALMTSHDAMTDTFPSAAEVVTRRWGNSVTWEQALVNIDCELAGGHATITFNFHYSTTSAAAAEAILRTAGVFEIHQQRAIAAAAALSNQDLEA